MEMRLEAKDKERRLEELEEKMKEEMDQLEKIKTGLEGSTPKLRMEVEEEPLRKESASDLSNNNALTNLSLPIVIISAWRNAPVRSPQTVTFENFLATFNNADQPGGGDGVLDLDSGVFTCFTHGY